MTTEEVTDALAKPGDAQQANFRIISMCAVEHSNDFSLTPTRGQQDAHFLVIVTRVRPRSEPQAGDSFDVYAEAVQRLQSDQLPAVRETMRALVAFSKSIAYEGDNSQASSATWANTPLTPWTQRKSRRLSNFPTADALTDTP